MRKLLSLGYKPNMTTIYALINPETETPFYVGSTKQVLARRLLGHLQDVKKRTHKGILGEKQDFIISLLRKGLKPKISRLFLVDDSVAAQAEESAFKMFKEVGYRMYQLEGKFLQVEPKSDLFEETHFHSVIGDVEAIQCKNKEIIRLIANGFNADEIAKVQFKSTRTIETHIQRVKNELGAKTLAQLVMIAFKTGYLQ